MMVEIVFYPTCKVKGGGSHKAEEKDNGFWSHKDSCH